ncbi:hypothetical protein SAMN03159341_1445 [Paenibacillus sp. 1_12]|uniref:zinc dependent phospholipase C family protein n=1 Tax=Paenibacillus sp. 1_12 TaxID=1566278 RepID=UPI0008F1B91A|nr:zinc dependent phospholipase C family protein [Paenibacillus sp. 1_12]SFM53359.1 hypothetical protein SAMN03159341_1445 [Paenibacillus sp. 1_12]
MPWPMVHFAIATKVSFFDPSPSFLLGSIAPDAIHMRGNITRKEKGITHLMDEDKFPTIEVLKKECLSYLSIMNMELDWKAYILGYFAHIYADIRWTETIYAEFESEYQGDNKEIRKIYNQEVSQVEFNLLRSEEWAQPIIHRLQHANAYSIEPLVTQNEVSQYRDIKIEWLLDDSNEPKHKNIYFNDDKVRDFIINTSNELNVLFNEWGINQFEEVKDLR